MINAREEFPRLESELAAEENFGPVDGLSELAHRKERREALERRLASIEREVRLLRLRFQRLPALPDLACIRWAQSVLAYPNGRILIVDTAFAGEEVGVVHVLLLDFEGSVRFERHIAPGCLLLERAMCDLGMTVQDLQAAPSLPHAWPSLLEVLMGQYLVSYDLERARRTLERATEEHALDPMPIIGDCLLWQCQRYFQASGFVELSSLCTLVGHPLPAPPHCTAAERVRGQLHLLQSMAWSCRSAWKPSRYEVPDGKCGDEEIL